MEALKQGVEARPLREARPGRASRARLAADIGELEAALALERSVRSAEGRRPLGAIDEPSAAPLCDFLVLASGEGTAHPRLQAVCRLLPHGPREFARLAAAAPSMHASLYTALRYSGLGVLETGSFTLARGFPAAEACRALMDGIVDYMDARGMAFALGRETALPPPETPSEHQVAQFLEEHGLFSDAGRGRLKSRPSTTRLHAARIPAWLPPGLAETLLRGARLAGEALRGPGGELEFLWVAARNGID